MNSPKSINRLLFSPSKEIKGLLDRANYLNGLTHYLRSVLPKTVAPHCQVANIKMHNNSMTLVLITDSPAWSTRLRLHIPSILTHMQKHPKLKQLASIRIKTRPPEYHYSAEENIRLIPMSDSSAHIIEQAANSTQDKKLQNALLRLSRHGKNRRMKTR